MRFDEIAEESRQILRNWIASCTRDNKVSRNTVAVGIVVLDHLRQKCPVLPRDVTSQGGEIKGARSGLPNILVKYELPATYLKEVTTRQGHQDGQRLFQQFDWGNELKELTVDDRENLLAELIGTLRSYAIEWLQRQNLKLDIDRRQAPYAWINLIVENAKERSGGVVEQHLVGAKLARRFRDISIPNFPAHAGDRQTERAGDFTIASLVYHVTATPSRNVLQKCVENIKAGFHPILLVPQEQENKARVLAQDEDIDKQLMVVSLESFISLNILELAAEEHKDFFSVLKEIVQIYNQRLAEVETDQSLQIHVR